MSDLPHLQVIREHEFEDALHQLIPDFEQADEFVAAAEDVLSRDPLLGMPVTADGSIWSLAMSPVAGRAFALYYSFDESTVTFLFIAGAE